MKLVTGSLVARRDGFSLMELLVTITIIAILGLLAYSGFANMRTHSMSTEAKNTLGDLRKMAETYKFEYSIYAKSLNSIGFIQPAGTRYSYSIADASSNSCTFHAEGKPGTSVAGDVWVLEVINDEPHQPYLQ